MNITSIGVHINRLFLPRKVRYHSSLDGLMKWLVRAIDATSDDGVAQAYFIKKKKWAASYPETTGYIIPTFMDYYHSSGRDEYLQKAIKMADWLANIQFKEGGIQASTIDVKNPVPTVFNTGMVIFGFARTYLETGSEKYKNSTVRAADWLISIQEPEGYWQKYGSSETSSAINTYNTRVSWALLETYKITKETKYLLSAEKNLDWAINQQLPNGWLKNNCLLDNTQPYTHTIAYAMRGFLESSAFFKTNKYLDSAIKVFDGLKRHIKPDGFLSGRFNSDWEPTVAYCCLTGNAQLAINAFRLYQMTGEAGFLDDGVKLLNFVLKTQNLSTKDQNIFGGIMGSFPISGKYHPYQYPNWASKFTVDAILEYLKIQGE